MIKTLLAADRSERERFRIPRSVQQSIPIQKIYRDGIWQTGGKFSRTWRFADINYALASHDDQRDMFTSYCGVLNSLPTDATTKITINNRRLNGAEFRRSKTLQDISRYLGRFREIFAQGKRNGYAYGRGEKYALELGNDLPRALTSELAMLAVPETLPLFLRKYQHRQIKQYRRREPVYKGAGDIICCLDESGSTAGDLAAWGKAVALTLLEIAQSEGRKFALVHFSGPGRFQTDVFLPGQSSLEEKLHAAETFLGGGTDFQTPLAEAERLMREGGFENADIAFITDGECSLPETCVEMLQKAQSELRFTVTGILLDEGNAGMDFSLKPFCQNIYRTSELTGDQIVGEIVLDRV